MLRAPTDPVEFTALTETAPGAYAVPMRVMVHKWLLALSAAAGMVGAYAVPYFVPGSFTAIYFAFPASVAAGLLCVYAVRAAVRMRERFVAEADGLRKVRSDGATDLMEWGEVVRVRQRPWLQRLELGARDGRAWVLDYQLEDFDLLVTTVLTRVSPAAAANSAQGDVAIDKRAVFRSGRARWALPAMVPVVIVSSASYFGGVLMLAWILAAVLLWWWMSGWSELRLEAGALVLERPFRTRRITARNVTGVIMLMENAEADSLRPAVTLLLSGGEVLQIDGVREGEMALYAALLEWQRTHAVALAPSARAVPEAEGVS